MSLTRSRLSSLASTLLLLPIATLHARTVTLTPADNHLPLSLYVGDTLNLAIPAIPVPGMHLIPILPAHSPLVLLGSTFEPSSNPHLPGTRTFRFNAADPGDLRLLLRFEATGPHTVALPSETLSVPVHIASGEPSPGSFHPVLLGIYTGDLPCADCSALRTRLTLYTSPPNDFTQAFYLRRSTYLNGPHGTVTHTERGVWTILRGDASNPDATVYQLNPDSPRPDNLLRGFNTLTQLDPDLKPIPASANLTLKLLPATRGASPPPPSVK